jgi:hypothetical protein
LPLEAAELPVTPEKAEKADSKGDFTEPGWDENWLGVGGWD